MRTLRARGIGLMIFALIRTRGISLHMPGGRTRWRHVFPAGLPRGWAREATRSRG